MYHDGGNSYIYLCYGIHHLFNVVTNIQGIPHAVLIRAISIEDGIDIAVKRRKSKTRSQLNTKGPGTLTQALGITTAFNTLDLNGNVLWIEDSNRHISENEIHAGPRIGVNYADEDAQLPYRFWINE
ncbi:MAG: DNA-3-methyladenine glycosylase [Bacteroidetes bacterium]|nr:DNA-3-methyladenine glycosylase [Bacteroidota bacterium]